MSAIWNRTANQDHRFRCWPHLYTLTDIDEPDAGFKIAGYNSPEIVPPGLVELLWTRASYSVDLTVSIGATSLTIDATKALGNRDAGFTAEASTLDIGTVIGAGGTISSLKQRIEVHARNYPADFADEGYTGGAGTSRIDSCTAFYAFQDLPDPEGDPETDFFRNELGVVFHQARHYVTTFGNVPTEDVFWDPSANKWYASTGLIHVRATMRAAFGDPTYNVWTTILGPSDTSTTIDAFGGDLILGHDPELTVTGSISGSGYLPLV